MTQVSNPYRYDAQTIASEASANARVDFIRKTYLHLAGAVGAFALILTVLMQFEGKERLIGLMLSGYNWLIVLGLFMVVSWVADRWAQSATSMPMQYAGLGLYVVVQAVIFLPLIYVASEFGGPGVIPTAALITALVFGGLTFGVFTTGKDFSFIGPALSLGGVAALGFIACSIVFGFSLGTVFTAVMIALAGGYVLYSTSNVLYHYRIGQHVAASLAMFAAVALLFWYILRLAMAFTSRD